MHLTKQSTTEGPHTEKPQKRKINILLDNAKNMQKVIHPKLSQIKLVSNDNHHNVFDYLKKTTSYTFIKSYIDSSKQIGDHNKYNLSQASQDTHMQGSSSRVSSKLGSHIENEQELQLSINEDSLMDESQKDNAEDIKKKGKEVCDAQIVPIENPNKMYQSMKTYTFGKNKNSDKKIKDSMVQPSEVN